LAERIARELAAEIVSGAIAPGGRLRQEELALRFGVSQGSVREALRALVADDLVTIEPHRGARVREFQAREIREVLELRVLLECEALRLAFPALRAGDLSDATAVADAIDRLKSPRRWTELNWQFHRALYRAADRPLLFETIEKLHADPRMAMLHHAVTVDVRRSNREHRAILRAVEAGSADDAVRRLRDHIGVTSPQLRKRLSEMEGLR